MAGVTGVTVISVPVSDQERSRDFYVDALGFSVLEDARMGPTFRWLAVGVPGTAVNLTLVTWFDAMPPGSLQGLVLEVDDIDALAADLHARGYIASAEVQSEPWGRFTTLTDPDGNSMVLQMTSGH